MSRTPILIAVLLLLLGLPIMAASEVAENRVPDDIREILEKAESFELYSLNPRHSKENPEKSFHGYPILGKTEVKEAKTRAKLVAAFERGVKENQDRVAACFNPRHGIRVVRQGKTADLVICFECMSVSPYLDGKEVKGFLISPSPKPVFDKVLKDAKVPLAGD